MRNILKFNPINKFLLNYLGNMNEIINKPLSNEFGNRDEYHFMSPMFSLQSCLEVSSVDYWTT